MKKNLLPLLFCLLLSACTNNKEVEYAMANSSMLPNIPIDVMVTVDQTDTAAYTYGDIIAFWFEGTPEYPSKPTPIIQRIVGLPGDSIAIKNEYCIVNGQMNPHKFIREKKENIDGIDFNIKEYQETLPNGISLKLYADKKGGMFNDTEAVFITENHYFVMGDFRTNTVDSRYTGLLPKTKIIGKVTSMKEIRGIKLFFYKILTRNRSQNQNMSYLFNAPLREQDPIC